MAKNEYENNIVTLKSRLEVTWSVGLEMISFEFESLCTVSYSYSIVTMALLTNRHHQTGVVANLELGNALGVLFPFPLFSSPPFVLRLLSPPLEVGALQSS